MSDKFTVTPLRTSGQVQLETAGRRTILKVDEALELSDELKEAAKNVSSHSQNINLDQWNPEVEKY